MTILTRKIPLSSKGDLDIIDITQKVAGILGETELMNGIITVFVPGATGALTTIEYEPGLLKDLPMILERIAPKNLQYEHDKRNSDDNGHSHVRASLIGPSITIPFINGCLALGKWQKIVFIELDTRSRNRELICQVIGE